MDTAHGPEDTPSGPLAGIRVIEVGQLIAGPFVGQLLGDFGAEVIKVELPGLGDPMRQWGRIPGGGDSLWWAVIARPLSESRIGSGTSRAAQISSTEWTTALAYSVSP